ncbi:hypothetical protein C8R44DRAFT_789239 [Mycena epipterygia]|nr:hypothetical protein C8R44DRAFT_789239 [Mycena epipterygia]
MSCRHIQASGNRWEFQYWSSSFRPLSHKPPSARPWSARVQPRHQRGCMQRRHSQHKLQSRRLAPGTGKRCRFGQPAS